MDLLERLRPRWRHADPVIRTAAVREMGPDDRERLAAIARDDADAGVRRAAVKRLDDPAVLDAVATADSDESVRHLASERARELRGAIACSERPLAECETALAQLTDDASLTAVAARAAHEAIRRAALGRIGTDRALRDVVRTAADASLGRAALDRIQDPAQLRAVAVSDCPPDLALLALERITDPGILLAVAESTTATKSVRRRARALLPADVTLAPAIGEKQARARQLELSTTVSGLRGAADLQRAAERVRAAQEEWDVLARAAEPRDDVARRFAVACAAVLDEAASLARRLAETDMAHARVADAEAAAVALCERVEALDGADALRALDAARAEWRRLGPLDAGLERRFASAADACAARHRNWLAHEGLRSAIEAVLGEGETLAEASSPPAPARWEALARRWASLDLTALPAAERTALQERFTAAGERFARRRQEAEERRQSEQEKNVRRLDELQGRLETLAGAESVDRAPARRALEAADAALADLGPLPPTERRAARRDRLSAARDALARTLGHIEELEDWRRWANTGAQEEIIQRVEALLESSDLAEMTRQLGRLQDDWARVATATPERSQTLWERFRTARDELRRRCDVYMAENLEKKRALCAQVADLGESTAWNETAALIKRLQGEWKEIGPVPGKHAKAIWTQFREPCDRFFARRNEYQGRLDAERAENARRKTALCEQAEALALSTDWDTTTTAMKRLQTQWKSTGPAPRAEGDALWARFRAACDRFFDRSRRRDELAQEESLAAATAVCARLDALADTLAADDAPSTDDVRQAIDETWAEWVKLDVATLEEARALAERLHAACTRIAAARPESLEGTRIAPGTTRGRREKLCAKLEELVPAAAPPPQQQTLQEMALALRERLATRTIATGATAATGPKQDVGRELARIETSWAHLGPPLDDDARALADRFEQARARVRAAQR